MYFNSTQFLFIFIIYIYGKHFNVPFFFADAGATHGGENVFGVDARPERNPGADHVQLRAVY